MTDRFRLNKIVVRNFKAIRQSGEIKLTPLTVFIGNNGSGKSSLIEGLEVYCDIMIGGIDHAFERWFGVEDTWNKSIVHLQRASKSIDETFEDPITIQLSGHRGRGAFTSLLEVALGIMDDETRIEREFLKLPGDRVYQGGRTSLLA